MLANWVKATTTTTGTGTLTLSAVTGFPRPADARAVGTIMQYVILASNGDKESGFGRIAAGNTFERSTVTATYVSGTYNGSPSGPITLPSGTHEFITTVTSAAAFQSAMYALTDAGISSRTLPSRHMRSTQANTTGVAVAQRQTAYPYLLQTSGVLTEMTINVATAQAGSAALLALYEIATDGGPGRRLAAITSSIDTSTTGFKSQSIGSGIRMTPGWYWTAMNVVSGSPATLTGATADMSAFGNSANAALQSLRNDSGTTTLDDPFPTLNRVYSFQNSPTIPYIGLVLT